MQRSVVVGDAYSSIQTTDSVKLTSKYVSAGLRQWLKEHVPIVLNNATWERGCQCGIIPLFAMLRYCYTTRHIDCDPVDDGTVCGRLSVFCFGESYSLTGYKRLANW